MSFNRLADLVLRTCTRPNVFGEWVHYLPAKGDEQRIRGIFDEAFQQVDASSQDPVSSTRPKLGVILSDLSDEPGPSDRVRIRGKLYSVIEDRPDGRGGATLYLELMGNGQA